MSPVRYPLCCSILAKVVSLLGSPSDPPNHMTSLYMLLGDIMPGGAEVRGSRHCHLKPQDTIMTSAPQDNDSSTLRRIS